MPTETAGPTLTTFTYLGRQGLKFGGILLVALIVGRTFLSAFTAYWKATHPAPPPPPTVGFGLLPAIRFPDQTLESRPKSYTLETATGRLPEFGDRAKVFFMPLASPSLLDDERAKATAARFGFVFEPQRLDARSYQFAKSQPLATTFELDIVSNQFELETDFLSRPELIEKIELPNENGAISTVKNALTRSELLGLDLATASAEVTYLRAVGADLEPAVSFADAQFAQVDLNRTPIDGQWLVYTPDGKGVVHAVLAGALQGPDSIVKLLYRYHPVDYTQIHTYPLRTAQDAWKVLQGGAGFVVRAGNLEQATVRKVTLGYFDSFEDQQYLQPVYVFEGDDGFMAYVPALNPQFVQAAN